MAYYPPSSARCLRLRVDSAAEFAREYREHVSRGGAFVPGASDFELRAPVQVLLELSWCRESVQLAAEIVHVVPAKLAAAGGTAGVAVQFQIPAPELRDLLGRFAEETGATKPEPSPAPPRASEQSECEADEAFAYHTDALGSGTEITDNVGTVVASKLYDAYGNVLAVVNDLLGCGCHGHQA